MSPKTIVVAMMAFVLPIGFIAYTNRDAIEESFKIDKSVGRVIYFTAPG